jgi:hypothetical protein
MLIGFLMFEAACAAGLLVLLAREGQLRFGRRRSVQASALPAPQQAHDASSEKLAA